jgi:putative membrane protein
MMYWNGDWNGWAWFVMGLSMLVFWGLIAFAIWLVLRGFATANSTRPAAPGPSAEETLRQRYAAGELDDEEFNRRLRVLRGDRMTSPRGT